MADAKIILRDTSTPSAASAADVARKLSVFELLWNDGFVRKSLIIVVLAAIWQAYGSYLDNPLLFPTFSDTIAALWEKVRDGTIPMRAWTSLKVLFMGYAAGIALAAILTVLAISTRIGTDFLETVTAMFNPLPAIALLPLALIWFGLGSGSLVFVLIHSVLWPVALSVSSVHDIVPNPQLLGAFAFLVLGGSILAYVLWFHLLKVCGATAASAYHFVMPPLAMIFAFVVLGEHVALQDLFGVVPVAIGIYLVTRTPAPKNG
ncbi:MAG: EamA family transporter [Bradyrhizobium sp.]|uniref:EamA family transporter n=1 Tax=Bradyrhizobium sp. TaxID=376 RepID=UPI0028FDFCDD|nr:EamA family transporter [Bradyrhizobium sp.]MDU3127270.1 EamA family transporter [Bradyrhizobium sp.]